MRVFCRSSLTAFLVVSVTACGLAPGFYVDDLATVSDLDQEVEIITVDADIVAQLEAERYEALRAKREMAHRIFKENRDLKAGYEYRIGSGDLLSIIAWGHPELNIGASAVRQGAVPRSVDAISLSPDFPQPGHEVDREGRIFYPYVGLLDAAGKTINEVRSELSTRLAQYIPEPQVDVGVVDYRSQRVHVLGEVNSPQSLPITQVPLEIIDVLPNVGGLTESADTRNVILVRDGRRYGIDLQAILSGDMAQNYVLRGGDVLIVPDNRYNSVFLLGEFVSKAKLYLPNTRFYSLADAITDSAVGGFSPEVDPSRLFVFRYAESAVGFEPGAPTVFHLNAGSAENFLLATKFPLLPRDIIYVATSDLARWNRVVQRLLPTVQAIHDPLRAYSLLDTSSREEEREIDRELIFDGQ